MNEEDIIRIIETDPDNAEFIKLDFDLEVDTEYLEWYCTHGDDKQDYIDNLISYCEDLERKESL